MKIPEAGDEIESYCTKCKLNLNHRVVAMVGDIVKRVSCLTCKADHVFRKPKVAKKKTVRKGVGVRAREAAEAQLRADWTAHVDGQPSDAFSRYSMNEQFSEGDLVSHKKFGPGYVLLAGSEGKVEILFEEGVKRLAHGVGA